MMQVFLGLPSETRCATHDHIFWRYWYSDMLTNYAVMKFWSTVGKQFYKSYRIAASMLISSQEMVVWDWGNKQQQKLRDNKFCLLRD
jgi:hypothetical protein